MPDEEYRYELENRIKNLLWTVSGDYALEVSLDIDSFQRSKYISLYDAVKQGAFARFFSKDAFGMYLVKKAVYGSRGSFSYGIGADVRRSGGVRKNL